MGATPFYRPVTSELYQGDVFERVPLVQVKTPPAPLIRTTLPGKQDGFTLGEPLSPDKPPKAGGLIVPAACDYTRAILLTYDCEIDKPATKILTLALVRPLDASMPDP